MIETLSLEQLELYLMELLEWDALEICEDVHGKDILIPYVMNDAVESFVRLRDCKMIGEWDAGYEGDIGFALEPAAQDRLAGLILRQGMERAVTIWFQEAVREVHCYQYHRIGHNWRKQKGEEQWRRLVNILCVLHDKYQFLGAEFCNDTEVELQNLIECLPLSYWTPINDSIQGWYPETEAGVAAMRRLTEGLWPEYAAMLEPYGAMKTSSRKKKNAMLRLAKELTGNDGIMVYRKLLEMVEQASGQWEARTYLPQLEKDMETTRARYTKAYREQGYEGEYPLMNWGGEGDRPAIRFVEEHPFTVMESEDYHFSIFPMEETS